jgi:hypothetical protein
MPDSQRVVNDPEKKNADEANWWQPGLAVFGEVTGWIVVPIIIALYLGRQLDEQRGMGNLYFLSLTGTAFIISCTGIWRIGARYIKQVDESNKNKKKDGSSSN